MSLTQADRQNFATLKQAFANGDVALVEMTETQTGKTQPAICAVGEQDGKPTFMPFAFLVTELPFPRFQFPSTGLDPD